MGQPLQAFFFSQRASGLGVNVGKNQAYTGQLAQSTDMFGRLLAAANQSDSQFIRQGIFSMRARDCDRAASRAGGGFYLELQLPS